MNKEDLTQDVQEELNQETNNEKVQSEEKPKAERTKFQEMIHQFVDGKGKKGKDEAAEKELESEEELSETEKLEAEINQLKAEKEEVNDKYLRLFAEFQNYKRRTAKEKMDIIQTAGRDVIKVLLPVLDDFDRAKNAADSDDSVEAFSEGVELVYEKLNNTLKQQGVKALKSNGEVFNPDIHEAITEIPAPNDELKGKIIDTIEKGYTLNDKIIRFAKVVIGK